MNILVLNGSPKEKSDTMVLTRAFLKGLEKTGNHDVTIIDVIKKKYCSLQRLFWMLEDSERPMLY